jgi:hypothetical protein
MTSNGPGFPLGLELDCTADIGRSPIWTSDLAATIQPDATKRKRQNR